MAQTSSAAREPSMEEILASIRRIIEDSDVSRHPMPAASAFPARGDVAKFRTPTHIQDAAPKAEEKPALKSVVFKEEPVLRGAVSEPALDVTVADAETEEDDEDFFVLNAQNDDNFSEVSEPVAKLDDAPSLETQIASELNIAQTEQVTVLPAEAPVIAKEEPVNLKPSSTDHILSEDTERKVSAAFQDLNHAVHLEPRRSFDDIASEILRPMLQNWLDTNLPPLVERLVREEIERVVRGER
ncbi:PopZ family protein [Brucella pseudogrignonensis]|uniref:PopZ family protein n=1 Tax=Brucella pseudogrignonensis TaxID=419475 RepID=UPI0028BA5EF3|nr:PopZ family protein [Brucella pseudogrignonensis]MDT6938588.1 PopZ family protein [Brucella pseudogrignonensis]